MVELSEIDLKEKELKEAAIKLRETQTNFDILEKEYLNLIKKSRDLTLRKGGKSGRTKEKV